MSDNSSNKVIKNFIWRFAERCGAQGVSFIVSIVLARLLTPDAYGTVALITVFINILNVFVDSGLGTALIQKKNTDDLDFSTVFFFNFAICIFLYGGMFIAAPIIARFYGQSELTPLIRVMSLVIVISGVKNIQQAYVSKQLLFKKFFFATIGGTIFSAFFGIGLAYCGFGCWALVGQQLSNTLIDTVILWITVQWRPKWKFSFARLQTLYSYGWKLLVSALLDTGYNNLRNLLIGKIYSASDLAYYNQGQKFPNVIVSNINSSIDSVLLPVMSSAQDEKERLKQMTRKAIKTSSYLMWPLMTGLAVCAKPIIQLLLTDKWLPCVPFLQLFCFSYVLWPIHTSNLNAIRALGRSDVFLKMEIIKKVLGIITILFTVKHGVFVIAVGAIALGPISVVINSYPNKKLINYSLKEQMIDLLPYVLMSVVMGGFVWCVHFINLPTVIVLIVQIIIGIGAYVFMSEIFRIQVYYEAKSIIINKLKSNKFNGKERK